MQQLPRARLGLAVQAGNVQALLESALSFPSGGAVGSQVARGHGGERRGVGKDGLGESWPIRSQLSAFLKPLPTSLGWPQSQDPQVLRRVPGVGGEGSAWWNLWLFRRGPQR